jgi:AraC family transcriptional regulator of adaptative response/methylated-DNA-[protein]-cysteine methyltransferase
MEIDEASAVAMKPGATLDAEVAWQQVISREPAAKFFYAVATTGVFCRPNCKSRRPLRENVRFFATAEEAQAAGFRACKRCKPTSTAPRGVPATEVSGPLERIRRYIEAHRDRAVPLAELGRMAGLSPFTVQRLFKKDMGVSPLQYQRALRAGSLRSSLRQGGSVTEAIYEAGFGSSSRAYEGAQLGMTPGRFAKGGQGEQIGWCAAQSPFGWMVVGATQRGLCWLALADTAEEAEASLRAEFPLASLKPDAGLKSMVDAAVEYVGGAKNPSEKLAAPQVELAPPQVELAPPQVELAPPQAELAPPQAELAPPQVELAPPQAELAAPQAELAPPQVELAPPQVELAPPQAELAPPQVELAPPQAELAPPQVELAPPQAELAPPQVLLDLRGTAFQLRVWQALRAIPRGETRSYSQLAREMGDAKATRAVARACATNRVALVVPCHRVVGVSGSLTGYRWGVERKRQLLEIEKGPISAGQPYHGAEPKGASSERA